MGNINQNQLNEFISYLKKDKFKNKILKLNLELSYDDDGEYILINTFLIKKNVRCLGYGSLILYHLTKFADEHNVRIKYELFCNLKRLQGFYLKNRFTLIKTKEECSMVYLPKK